MTFDTLGLRPALLARLADQNLTDPTPIQQRAIPEAMAGRDVMGLAQTGTGKTFAFGLPIADALLGSNTRCAPKSAQALILAPTRELAAQIHDTLSSVLKDAHLRLTLVVGGNSINVQSRKLEKGTHLLIATPGRLIDLMDRGALKLDQVSHFVLDEADQMLDLGFIHALRRIARDLPSQRQTLLFSATMPKQMNEIASAYLNDPVRIEVAPPGKTADKIEQSVIFVETPKRIETLTGLLDDHRDELALVFCRTKHGAEKLSRKLDQAGFAVGAIHGNKSQGQRNRALDAFRKGEMRVLVATDVAARGIDIPDVRHVYNFDLPNVADNYVHRIGRTARAGRDGRAVSFCGVEEMGDLRGIEKLIGQQITTLGGERPAEPAGGQRRGRGGNGGGQGRPGGGKSAGKPGGARRSRGGRGRRSGGGGGGNRGRAHASA
ncbi:DEAD/DEAH box helicase [Salipiger sp. CCB-MM3]|uniref:DEAD/DEAH box helicase n=1 Tax=Salipiger sp. CCB-MM3 TaxID=1792508 RepID=UPI00080AA77D|nr:DEAD/DEAH box helicase [Salipiger sp. CCB-MM3]ANT59929.1 DEAD/DEAH box helicase [Salipiger sp. CCB-MM3]